MRRFMEQRKRRDPVQAGAELMIENGPQHERGTADANGPQGRSRQEKKTTKVFVEDQATVKEFNQNLKELEKNWKLNIYIRW